MASIIGIILSIVLCSVFGQFSLAVLIAGFLSIFGVKFSFAREMSIFTFMTALLLCFVASSQSVWAVILPAIVLFILKEIVKPHNVRGHIWVALLPIASFVWLFQDRDLQTVILIFFAIALPNIYNHQKLKSITCQKNIYILSIVLIGTLCFVYFIPRFKGKTAFIDSGEWARADIPFTDVNKLNIEKSYGYSELKSLLMAEIITPDKISREYSEAWIITPTRPLDQTSIRKLLEWVRDGGRLIIVTDHTDLFGHAKVVNELLSSLGCSTSNSAFFPLEPQLKASVNMGKNCCVKTSNIQYGSLLWPQMSARWINELSDYSDSNFFGPLSFTSDDGVGRRIISGSRAVGRGRIVLYGDSTSLANFAIYQPHVLQFVERLRSGGLFAGILPVIWIMLTLAIIIAVIKGHIFPLGLVPLLGLFVIFDFRSVPVTWGDYDYWSGDEKAVMEYCDSTQRIATAFSISPLAGHRPRWIDNPNKSQFGIWVGYFPPPNEQWRWVDLSSSEGVKEIYDRSLDPLLSKITGEHPYMWKSDSNFMHVSVAGLWTDDVMGDWWFEQGISESKQKRFSAWLSWLSNDVMPEYPHVAKIDMDSPTLYKLKISDHDWQEIRLPKITLDESGEIYLGRGVSASIIVIEGKKVLFGSRTYTESWKAPKAWILSCSDTLNKSDDVSK